MNKFFLNEYIYIEIETNHPNLGLKNPDRKTFWVLIGVSDSFTDCLELSNPASAQSAS